MANTGERGAASAAAARKENIDLRAVLRTIRQPLLVLDGALAVVSANAAFCTTFATGADETEGQKIYDLGNGQWNIPELRRLLEEILPSRGEVSDFRVEHDFEAIGRRIMVLNAYRMERGETADRILLTIDDQTERERLRWELEARKEYAEKIVDASRNALLVLDSDLRVKTANETFYRNFRVPPAETEGRRVYELGNGQWDIPRLRDLLENVLPENETFDDFEVEHVFEDIGWRTMALNARKIDHMDWILLEIEDLTETRQAEAGQRESEARYRYLFDSIDQGFCVIEVLFDEQGHPVDYLFVEVNGAFERQTGLTGAEGRTIRSMAPGHEEFWFETYGRIATSRQPERFKHRAEALGAWYDVFAFPVGEPEDRRVAVLFNDILDRKTAEAALRESEERQAFLLRLADALRPLSDTGEIAGAATRLLGEWLGATRAYFVEWPQDARYAEVARDHAAPGRTSLAGRDPAEVFRPTYDRLADGATRVMPDAGADTETEPAERARSLRAGVVAAVEVPLLKDGVLDAALCVEQDGPRHWTEAEVALVEETAERCWAAIERGRAEAQLREITERYAHIVAEASDYAIFTMDAEGRITSWPPGAAAVFGWSEAEMLGAPVSSTFVPEDLAAGAAERELSVAARDGSAANIRWHLRKDGTRIFIDGAMIRLGAAGAEKGFIKIGQDVTERRRSEELLRESEARLKAIFAGASVGLSEIDPTGRILSANDELCRILGRTRDEVLSISVAEVTHPEDLPRTLDLVGRVFGGEAGGAAGGLDKRYIRPDGTEVWAHSRATLLKPPEGGPGTLLTVTVDLTERRKAEAAVRESEARFRQFGDASSDILWIRDARTLDWEYLNPAFERVYGASPEEVMARRGIGFLMELILPEDREATAGAIAALPWGPQTYEYRVRRLSDGEVRWLRTTAFPLTEADGKVRRIGGITHDTTEEKRTADRMEVLVAELQHRTRNLIGITRALASRTLRSSRSLPDFSDRFGARLDALARVNGLLSRLEEGDRITFDELLETELSGHGITTDGDQRRKVTLRGPRGVRLPSASVQTLALALHELLTNATKYGALSGSEGKLAIRWELVADPEPRLAVEWRETGIVVADQSVLIPGNGGYGRQLIERALPFQLGATTTYDLGPDGLLCTIVLPVPH